MVRPIRTIASQFSGKRLPWIPALLIAVVFLATATARAETGRITLRVTDDYNLVPDASVSIHTPSGENLEISARTDEAGIAAFAVPAGSYRFCVDHCGDRTWSDVVHTLPNEETKVELSLGRLAQDKTLDPHPVRFDGTPPEKEPVMLASLVDLSGILTQSTVATVNRDKLYWYINDHLGTPMMIVDENRAVVWEGAHLPFGDTAITVNTIENNFRFPGQYFDAESGLHYNYHRYYDPSIGRYFRSDPTGLSGGINIYSYAAQNPLNSIDPLGLEVLDAAFGWPDYNEVNLTKGQKRSLIQAAAGVGLVGAGALLYINPATAVTNVGTSYRFMATGASLFSYNATTFVVETFLGADTSKIPSTTDVFIKTAEETVDIYIDKTISVRHKDFNTIKASESKTCNSK